MRVPVALVLWFSLALTGCETRSVRNDTAARRPEPAPCAPGSYLECRASDVKGASHATLLEAGPLLKVSCGSRFSEAPVDAAYMQSCVELARELSAYLSQRWPTLEPIEPGTIRYDWNTSEGCITFVDNFCICPVRGEALIPLRWRDETKPAPVAE